LTRKQRVPLALCGIFCPRPHHCVFPSDNHVRRRLDVNTIGARRSPFSGCSTGMRLGLAQQSNGLRERRKESRRVSKHDPDPGRANSSASPAIFARSLGRCPDIGTRLAGRTAQIHDEFTRRCPASIAVGAAWPSRCDRYHQPGGVRRTRRSQTTLHPRARSTSGTSLPSHRPVRGAVDRRTAPMALFHRPTSRMRTSPPSTQRPPWSSLRWTHVLAGVAPCRSISWPLSVTTTQRMVVNKGKTIEECRDHGRLRTFSDYNLWSLLSMR